MRTLLVVALVVCLAGSAPSPAIAQTRVIEVVDAIPDGAWNVRAAVRWMGKRTASRMRVVSRKCSATAYRCIRIQDGEVSGPIGRSRQTTITIDTQRAAREYGRWYGAGRKGTAKNRTWLLVHELGHQLGLRHSTGANVMNEAVNRYRMTMTAGQRAHLRRV